MRFILRRFLGPVLLCGLWGQVMGAGILNFPRVSFGSDTITGVAVANPGTSDAQVTLSLYGSDGVLLQAPGLVNPRQVSVPAGQQYADVTSVIFGTAVPESTVAWLQATSEAEDLTGFFLFLSADTTFFDGADLPRTSGSLLFTEVRVDAGFSTEVNLVNPSSTPATVVLRLMGGASPVIRTLRLPPRGAARMDARSFFDVSPVDTGASPARDTAGAVLARYLVAESDGPEIAGFAFVRGAGDLLGQNAVPASDVLSTLYFPQLAVLGPFQTQLVVANTGTETAILTISARRPDGGLYDGADLQVNPVAMALPPGGVLRRDLEELFGFSGPAAREGWLQVDSSAASVTGSISYAIPSNTSLAAVASLTAGSRKAVFSHIATSLDFFTGLALLNPSSLAANYRVTALRRDGSVLGSSAALLRPGERVSRLIEQFVDEAAGQAGGLILVESDVPLYLTSLFGSAVTGVLANIPPQPVPDSYDPAAGLPAPRVAPPLAILAPLASQTFSLQGAAGTPTWSVNGVVGGEPSSGSVSPGGQFTAPALIPDSLPVTVSASAGPSQAGAAVDIISERDLTAGLGVVRSVAFLEGSRRVYASEVEGPGAVQGAAAASGPTGATTTTNVLEVTDGSRQPIVSLSGQDIVKMLGYVSGSTEYLLLLDGLGGALRRLNPATAALETLLGGLDRPAAMTFDAQGNLLVAEFGGVVQIPANALAEGGDRIAGGGLAAERLDLPAGATGLTGVAVNRCDNSIIVSSRSDALESDGVPSVTSGRLWSFGASGEARRMGRTVVQPGQLQALYRRGLPCPEAFQLLTVDDATGGIVLMAPSMDFESTWIADADAVDLAFAPAGGSSRPQGGAGLGEMAAVVIGAVDRGGETATGSTALADVQELYETAPVNPPRPTPQQADFDAVADFSASVNPAGVWSYGYSANLGGPFIPFQGPAEERIGNVSTPGAFFWALDIAGTVFDLPALGRNLSGVDIQPGTFLVPTDRLLLHPGQAGQYAVLRWTAPEPASYFVQGVFQGLDQTTTDVHVLIENSLLISRRIDGFGNAVNFSFSVTLPASGIPIDLAVGIGGNAFNFDSTGVQMTISRVN